MARESGQVPNGERFVPKNMQEAAISNDTKEPAAAPAPVTITILPSMRTVAPTAASATSSAIVSPPTVTATAPTVAASATASAAPVTTGPATTDPAAIHQKATMCPTASATAAPKPERSYSVSFTRHHNGTCSKTFGVHNLGEFEAADLFERSSP